MENDDPPAAATFSDGWLAFVLGLASLVIAPFSIVNILGWPSCISAFIIAHVLWIRIRKSPGRKGLRLALTGLIATYLALVLCFLVTIQPVGRVDSEPHPFFAPDPPEELPASVRSGPPK